ncbi:MAG TPA: alcohol dehydrogenase catalytic domain-containing protein [Firmicutes bacterium]|nr:alcohol dehydrogenase catalytic domain-containing protein [Bacillota bacterium]
MKALQFVDSVPRYVITKALGSFWKGVFYSPIACLVYRDIPEPTLPGPDWVKIRTRYSGICGSDVNLVLLHDSPSTSPYASFPFTIGHENVGVISEVGSHVTDFRPGDRVVPDPLLPCVVRGIEPPCPYCQRGDYSLCVNFTRGNIAPGMGIGTCRDTGGGWSPYFLAHRSQLLRVPDSLADEQAVLADPFASSLHPLMHHFPDEGQTVLVIGAGIIGLGIVAGLRALGSKARMVVLARHGFQAELAQHYGADQVVRTGAGYVSRMAEALGTISLKTMIGKPVLEDGADLVFECVGSSGSIDDALRFAGRGGKVVLVGLAAVPKGVDWSFIWLKELQVAGSFWSSTETHQGKPIRTYQLALDLMASGAVDLAPLLTHRFRLHEYKKAFATLTDKKSSHVVKAAFVFD